MEEEEEEEEERGGGADHIIHMCMYVYTVVRDRVGLCDSSDTQVASSWTVFCLSAASCFVAVAGLWGIALLWRRLVALVWRRLLAVLCLQRCLCRPLLGALGMEHGPRDDGGGGGEDKWDQVSVDGHVCVCVCVGGCVCGCVKTHTGWRQSMRIAGVIVVRTGREQGASAPITACTKEKNEKKKREPRRRSS